MYDIIIIGAGPAGITAGDAKNTPEKYIIVAVGQGCIASLSAFKYLSKKPLKENP